MTERLLTYEQYRREALKTEIERVYDAYVSRSGYGFEYEEILTRRFGREFLDLKREEQQDIIKRAADEDRDEQRQQLDRRKSGEDYWDEMADEAEERERLLANEEKALRLEYLSYQANRGNPEEDRRLAAEYERIQAQPEREPEQRDYVWELQELVEKQRQEREERDSDRNQEVEWQRREEFRRKRDVIRGR